MATAAELQARDKIFIGGEWVAPQGSETIEVINSSTEETMGTIPACTAADADRAVLAARDAFVSWSQSSREERAGYLSAIAAGLGERAEEIAATIAQELGMPLKLSQMIQAGLPTGQFAAMPGLMEEVAWEEEIGNSRILREPVGVLGARLAVPGMALANGMPRWKYMVNRALTSVENRVMGTDLSEAHTGYRAYSRRLLLTVPFLRNSNDFSFDSELLMQASHFGFRFHEVPCPTIYNNEASSVLFKQGVVYGVKSQWAGARLVLHRRRIWRSKKFQK